MADAPIPPLEVSVYVDAPPERVWSVVSDVQRMGEWSPECKKMIVWDKNGARQGGWVTGINKRKLIFWPTNSKIHVYDEGRAIGWKVLENRARWIYELKPEGEGTRLTERREMPDGRTALGRFASAIAFGGSQVHDGELLEGMQTTLERIKQTVESDLRP